MQALKTSIIQYKKLAQFCKKHGFFEKKTTVILGLSGGPDSVFLLHFLAELHHAGLIMLVAAHLDHQWRANSGKDVELCRAACQTLGIGFVTQRVSDLDFTPKDNGSQEDKARQQRRFFFEKIRAEHGADYVALGHHADDQRETFFIRLLRGTSLSGLVGMRAQTGVYIRPLLCLGKQEIIDYLDAHKIAYITDTTNNSDAFLRNRLRHAVLPALKQADNRFATTFEKTLEQLQATELFLEKHGQQQYELLVMADHGQYVINTKQFALLDQVIQYRVIIHWLRDYRVMFPVRNNFFLEIIQFLTHKRGGTHQIHHDWAVVKKNNRAHIVKKE